MQIPLDREAKQPLYLQIVAFVQQQIAIGNLSPGSVLPSIRTMANRHKVSKTIVSMAYAELNARGLVEGRTGQGTVVIATAPPLRQRAYVLPELSSSAATYDFIKQAYTDDHYNFSEMAPSPAHLPLKAFQRCIKAVVAEDMAQAFRYESADGFAPLRQAIARHLMDRGIAATAEEILITSGTQQALSLVINTLVSPGECVVVESPCYMGLLDCCSSRGLRVVPVAITDEGLDIDQLEDVFKHMRPRLLYSMPTFQNPTGTTLDLERRRRLVELAAAYDVQILEDGICSELQLTKQPPPALRALSQQVIHCGSFSKSLMMGLRIGYVVAPTNVIRRLILQKQAQDLFSPGILQRAVARFLNEGMFEPHLRRVLKAYRQQRNAALTALQTYMPDTVKWTEPDGGLSIWLRCPPGVDTAELYTKALAKGIRFYPGRIFYPANPPANYLRLTYGIESPQRIEQGVMQLAELLRSHILNAC